MERTTNLGRVAGWLVAVALLAAVGGVSARALPAAAKPALGEPVLLWQKGGCQTTWCRTGWYASPAVADLDNDGQPEVIWTDYRVVVVNGADGSDKWVRDSPGGAAIAAGRAWS